MLEFLFCMFFPLQNSAWQRRCDYTCPGSLAPSPTLSQQGLGDWAPSTHSQLHVTPLGIHLTPLFFQTVLWHSPQNILGALYGRWRGRMTNKKKKYPKPQNKTKSQTSKNLIPVVWVGQYLHRFCDCVLYLKMQMHSVYP